MNFNHKKLEVEEYSAKFFREFLEYVKKKYAGQYWHALPREMARFWKSKYLVDSNIAKNGGVN
jgi:hypothetical protein